MNNITMNKKVINVINDSEEKLNYHILPSEYIVVNYFQNKSQDVDISFDQSNDSTLIINLGFIQENDSKIKINGLIEGNNNKCVINVRSLAQNGFSEVNAKVKVVDNTFNNDVIEDLKAIIDGGNIKLMPILEIDTNEVNAAHYATIGGIDIEQLFYLESLGISKEKGIEILKEKFLYNIFSDDVINIITDGKELYE